MIARALGITLQAWHRWERRQDRPREGNGHRGRPQAIPEEVRERIRAQYRERYGVWGPQVLREWCLREGLGSWSAETIAKAIADLREEEPAPKPPEGYEVTACGVMWSEDGAGFRERGRRKELLLVQDEHARYKTGRRLVRGPAKETDVVGYLEVAFERYGAPLVLKHDGDAIFHGLHMRELLSRWQVVDLTGPRYWPGYNGKTERTIRDVRTMERAMRRGGVRGPLIDRLDVVIDDLNERRPRPVLGGCTAREVYERDHKELPDRELFIREVRLKTKKLRASARSRRECRAARRHAIEAVLTRYGLLQRTGDVSRDSLAQTRTE